MRATVQGIGINDANYKVNRKEGGKIVWRCPFYRKWSHMLQRVSPSWKALRPSYKEATLHEEWKTFSNFKTWMEKQDWEGKDLDKDILIPNNKLYSPETCVFVPPTINYFILDKNRSGYLSGVKWSKTSKCYVSSCSNPLLGKLKSLGYFSDELVAHLVWKQYKGSIVPELCLKYPVDLKVKEALVSRYRLSQEDMYYLKENMESAKIRKRYRVN